MSKSVIIREYILGCLDDIIETLDKQDRSDPESMSLIDLGCVRRTLEAELDEIKAEILNKNDSQ